MKNRGDLAEVTQLFYSKPLVYPYLPLQAGLDRGTCPEAEGSEQPLACQHSCYKLRAFAFQLPAP